jgi:hypothetical protein
MAHERYHVFYRDGDEHALRDLYGNRESQVWHLIENPFPEGKGKDRHMIYKASSGLRAIRSAAEHSARPGHYVAINLDTGEVTTSGESGVSIRTTALVRGLPEDDRLR